MTCGRPTICGRCRRVRPNWWTSISRPSDGARSAADIEAPTLAEHARPADRPRAIADRQRRTRRRRPIRSTNCADRVPERRPMPSSTGSSTRHASATRRSTTTRASWRRPSECSAVSSSRSVVAPTFAVCSPGRTTPSISRPPSCSCWPPAARRSPNTRSTNDEIERIRAAQESPPRAIGGVPQPPPDPSIFPGALGELATAVGAYLDLKFSAHPDAPRPETDRHADGRRPGRRRGCLGRRRERRRAHRRQQRSGGRARADRTRRHPRVSVHDRCAQLDLPDARAVC